jgi:predicted TIM-barrel fold metal-dependent hydrolase
MKQQAAKALLVDCHAYAGSGKTWGDPPREVDYSLELLFERGTEAGIDRHCVMPPRNETYSEANKQLARICEKHPQKLIGFAAHSPQREAGSLQRLLTTEVKSMGLRGVRSDGHPTRELLDTVMELGIPVMYYPATANFQQLGRYYYMPAEAYPKINFIIPHLGNYCTSSWTAHYEAIDLVKRYPNMYVDMSGVGSFKYVEMAVHELPPDRILFGTGAPELDPRVDREALRLLKLSPEHQAKVGGLNILRLLRRQPA